MWKFLLPITLISGLTAMARDFAVVQPDVYTQLAHAGWDISQPLWKPDSTQVIFDRPGNVDFTLEETAALDSLGAVRVPDSQVRDWLRNNGWILEGE